MERKTGYLASLLNVPPLIFRFQFNPTIVSDKKSYKYKQATNFGQWGFDKTMAAGAKGGAAGVAGGVLAAIFEDPKEIGALLINTKPLEPEEGELRTLSLDFELDASRPGPLDGEGHYGTGEDGSIEPDLAVLRAFMYPSWSAIELGKMLINKEFNCPVRPPECTFKYGSLSVDCVMRDLNIKITAFRDDASPLRAEISVTLTEQPFAFSPIVEYGRRIFFDIPSSYNREGIGGDFLAVTPIVGSFV